MRSVLLLFWVLVVWLLVNVFAATTVSPPDPVTASPEPLPQPSDECGHNLERPSSFFKRHFDFAFLKKFFKHWIPFTSRTRVKMQFFLYKRDFPNCGREIVLDQVDSLARSGFNASQPTRIIIHGWLSQSKGSFNRAVKNAYLSLVAAGDKPPSNEINDNSISAADADDNDDDDANDTPNDVVDDSHRGSNYNNNSSGISDEAIDQASERPDDFNIIVVDWSLISSNVNYFSVVGLIEDLGFLLAEFSRFLHLQAGLNYHDVYLIGHSLGAQIAGSAGKQVKPFQFNTIFALDAAGPKFRQLSEEFRIDASDAMYVESILTSSSLGFEQPVGHATFYPNFGKDQKKCYVYGCSHSRAYNYFAESVASPVGFWGKRCERKSDDEWIVFDSSQEVRMGGEPSTPKEGTFYVKTNDVAPYARGREMPPADI